ncbi:helix-turn-helix transcriptional regulator [uncultured Flavobacterium sp.]|uniref:helix-turn-helix transcriptional regulator n=1 Tax=uncultured Flavobacterium sp. TaxID=165435 RepID=UPI0025F6717D|nr:helix-turn-helix transcriptional regulator [uncultured Flavobacterium sp.]
MIKLKLQIVRLQRQLSQKEIADLIGMTQSTYSRKEKGITNITMLEWIKIAKVLDVEKDEIYQENISKKEMLNVSESQNLYIIAYVLEQIDFLQRKNYELKEKIRTFQK